jgi:predicted RNA-binding Zn ribbon-like protein
MMDVICRFGIEELLVVANTRHGPGGHRGRRARADEPMHDHLVDPDDARRFLADHEIEPAAVDALFDRYPLRLTPTGGLVSLHGPVVWPGLVADLLPAVVELRRERERLRMCGNPLCRFLFIDHSRNASRVWCEMAVCGNRVRGHRHRLRRLAG